MSSLIKDVAVAQARDELSKIAHLPDLHKHLRNRLSDVAFSTLLGFDDEVHKQKTPF